MMLCASIRPASVRPRWPHRASLELEAVRERHLDASGLARERPLVVAQREILQRLAQFLEEEQFGGRLVPVRRRGRIGCAGSVSLFDTPQSWRAISL
jgi:hypothetical protein